MLTWGIQSGVAIRMAPTSPDSPATKLQALIDLGPVRVVGHDPESGEEITRGTGLLNEEQIKAILVRGCTP